MKRIVYMVIMNLFYAPIWLTTIARMAREDDRHTVQERYDYIVRDGKENYQMGPGDRERFGGRRIYQRRMGLSYFPIIRDYLTCWLCIPPAPIPSRW